ncbi:uncharacterized protein LOC143235056 [Tachypleus tridentatus]|uniref:uncharacterized protein LOC143235056 n=1 Tax=Tachypleus tridentatus TaxID=6853 RepID=UPI003FD28ADC
MSNNKDETSVPAIKKSLAMKKKLRSKKDVIFEAKGTISKLFPLYGFIEINHPIKALIYFDAFCVEDGKIEKLSELNLKIGQVMHVCAKKGRPDGQAKFRATKVWRMVNHEVYGHNCPLTKNKNIRTTKINKLVSNGKLPGISSNIISSQQDSDISYASLGRCYNNEKLTTSTSTSLSLSFHSVTKETSLIRIKDKHYLPVTSWDKLRKITNQSGRICPQGEKKACITFDNLEEVVWTINDVVFDNNERVKNLIWHFDDNQHVLFDAIENNLFSGSWIATKVWIGQAPKSSLPDALKNEKYWQELVNKYASLFEVEYSLPNSSLESVNGHPISTGKENCDEVQSNELSINSWNECENWDSQDNTKLPVTSFDNGKILNEYEDYVSSTEDESYKRFLSNSKFQPTCSLQLESLNSQKVHHKFQITDKENIQTGIEMCSEKSFDSLRDHFDCLKLSNFSELSDSFKTGKINKNVLNFCPVESQGVKEETLKTYSDKRSLELFKTLKDSSNDVHEAVSTIRSQWNFNEEEDKCKHARFSISFVKITDENKGVENIEELKTKEMNSCNTTLQEGVLPSVKNVVNATGHLKKIEKYCIWIKVKNTLVPVYWTNIYLNGRRVCGITENLEDVLEESAVVHFAYMHTFAYNSEWIYVYSLWKGKKPKQISEPTVEEFLKELELKHRSFSINRNTYSTKKREHIGNGENLSNDHQDDSSNKCSHEEAATCSMSSKKQTFGREDFDSVTAQTPKLVKAELKSRGIQTQIGKEEPFCTCLHCQHRASVKKVIHTGIQTECCEVITDSTQTFSTGEIFYSRVYLDSVD